MNDMNLFADLGGSIEDNEGEVDVPSNHYSPGLSSSVEERALSLLGSGVTAESTASAIGVTPSRIAQLLGDEEFAGQVATLRYESLQKHNLRDGKYDSLEDALIEKLNRSLPLMVRPETILKAMSVVNSAKRRGQSTPQQVTNTQNIVNLIIPKILAGKFTINIDNQVIKAGGQDLLTMPSGNLKNQVEAAAKERILEHVEQPDTEQPEEQESVQEDRRMP